MNECLRQSALFNTTFQVRYIDFSTSVNIDEVGKFSALKIVKLAALIFNIARELLVFRPQLCYISPSMTGWGFYKDCLVAILLKIFGVPICYHLHGKTGVKREQGFINIFLHRIIYNSSHLIVLSERLITNYWFADKAQTINIVNNGITHNTRLSVSKKDVPFQVLFLSNMIEEKGPLNVLKVAAIMKGWGIDIRFSFVGKWADKNLRRAFFNEVRDNDLEGIISFDEGLYGPEKLSKFADTDVFILPTYYANECFPLVILEAMSFGLPVITSFEGAIPDIIEDGVNGFLVDPHDPSAMAEKIKYLANNPEVRKKLGKNARSKYLNQYTLGIFETNLTNTINELIN